MRLTKNIRVNLVILGALFIAAGAVQADDLAQKWVARYNGPANGEDEAKAMAVDGSGNIYVTGYSTGSGTGKDYTTIKYAPNGNQMWLARWDYTGNADDVATAIAVDGSGNVYVTGYSNYFGTSYDYLTIIYDQYGYEIMELPYDGPGSGDDRAIAIAVDGSGNVYVTGYSTGPGTGHDYTTIMYDQWGYEMWEARYNGAENGDDEATAIALDSSGNVYVTGKSWGGDDSRNDYATIKYDPYGNQMWVARSNWPVDYYQDGDDGANAIAVDASGNVYVTGYSWQLANGGMRPTSAYATIKYDTYGNQLWVSRFGDAPGTNSPQNEAHAIALDSSGNVYVTGQSCNSGPYPLPFPCPDPMGTCNNYDYTTIKYDTYGNQNWYAQYKGPETRNYWDVANAIAVDNSGKVYVTGESDLDYATIEYNTSGSEIGVARYNGPENRTDQACAIALDSSGNVYVTGYSYSSVTSYDYVTIKYGHGCNAPSWCGGADINKDGGGNITDFAILADHWLEGVEP